MAEQGIERNRDPEDPLATSHSMLEGVRAGEASGWWRLAGTYTGLVYQWAKRAGLQEADAQDVLQEVLLSVYRKVGAFEHKVRGGSFRGWLWTIARRKICDVYRAKRSDYPMGEEAMSLLRIEPPVFADGEAAEADGATPEVASFLEELESIRQEFNSRLWDAFWKTAVEERPAGEVAAELGMTAGAVRVAKHRVLERIRAGSKS